MRVAVIGAAGRTGRRVVEQGLSRGHDLVALARRPEEIGPPRDRLTTVAADVLDPGALDGHLAGCDAVISALGVGSSRASTTVYSSGVANILAAMDAHGVRRLAVISAAPVGPRAEQPFLERRVAMPILERIFGASYEDMRRMEALLRDSDVDWVALRPPRLVDRAAEDRYRIDAHPLPKARSLTYPDLASALLDSIEHDPPCRPAFVAN